MIKIKLKEGKKHSLILFVAALIGLIVSDIVDNLFLSAAAVLFAMAALFAEITEVFLNWKKCKQGGQ
ncbi:hypothetical protein CON65_16600 [Bacillus pseudomycoides]|uniref:Uncharacterized protein n=1 Tax=Bacillus pseudomycoides TaxID=64104 RepID=A0AA91VBJ7_9BACI|nr:MULTISPECIES: hypothetical protein [Bacillus]PEB54184.1 hypothetical protein COO03_06045 [Bacillus sp. AFS098217]PED81558.1 hypothetical protein CON65_16600 [Bacillus pseudomycoides]PEU14122.1 hypothetical protein CN525_18675 [Bacillus sp. AFS014408]PEU17391.1 hypothetical protein CN524_02385 [Bacillus sp. AFS019443]PFW63001.1 hypothetical protein COL20_10555 [Bacillus sp. AFS075034]